MPTAHIAVYDTLADWEPGHLLAELRTGRFTGRPFDVVSVPVAAICGATAGLARAGLLDERRHTSAAPEYLAATGYSGGAHYVAARAIVDDGLVTAGPAAPVQFACATLGLLGLLSEQLLDAYEGVFAREDASCYPALMAAAGARVVG